MNKPLNQFQAAERSPIYTKVDEFSLTVPDQTMTLREILTRVAQGALPPEIQKQTYHDGLDSFDVDETLKPDFDLTDAQRIKDEMQENKQRLEELEIAAKEEYAAKQKAFNDEAMKAESEKGKTKAESQPV